MYCFAQSSSQWRGVGFVITSQIWIARVYKVNIIIIMFDIIIDIIIIININPDIIMCVIAISITTTPFATKIQLSLS